MVQLSGLRALCAPSRSRAHACCPDGAKTTLPNSSSLPDCCVNSFLKFQGSISEARGTDNSPDCTVQCVENSVASNVPMVAISATAPQTVLPYISPPQNPLSQ